MLFIGIIMFITVALGIDIFRITKRMRTANLAKEDSKLLLMDLSVALVGAIAAVMLVIFKISDPNGKYIIYAVISMWIAFSGAVRGLLDAMKKRE